MSRGCGESSPDKVEGTVGLGGDVVVRGSGEVMRHDYTEVFVDGRCCDGSVVDGIRLD